MSLLDNTITNGLQMQHDDGSHLVELPPVRMTQVTVTLPDDVRQLYNEIEDLSRQRFEHMLQRQELEGGGNVMVCTALTDALAAFVRSCSFVTGIGQRSQHADTPEATCAASWADPTKLSRAVA